MEGSGHSERRKPADKGAKGIPPRREVISAPFGARRCQNGVSPICEMRQHSEKWSVARRARVKQVKHRTYANMVSVPLCTKLEMSDVNRGN